MTRACRPTLFDAAADPELLVAMLLANLTSPALWEFEARIAARIDAQGSPLSPGEVMLAIQSYADQHLFHISPLGVADTWGQLDLDEKRARLGSTVVDYLTAGTRGHLVQAQARQIADIDDALAIVQRIEGADSAVACTHRIALPNEVLKFNTGDAQDRAFLLCTLIGLADALPAGLRADREILIAPCEAFVRIGATCIRASDVKECQSPKDPAQRIAAVG